jgi:hypothetical protein
VQFAFSALQKPTALQTISLLGWKNPTSAHWRFCPATISKVNFKKCKRLTNLSVWHEIWLKEFRDFAAPRCELARNP